MLERAAEKVKAVARGGAATVSARLARERGSCLAERPEVMRAGALVL
jgi:hypothetical protein